MMFQMTFAIITPALICGAFADRMKFSALLWFIGLWSVLVYAPIAHWVWGPDGFLSSAGILDFAGGTVVHINAGVAGLMAALVLGKRRGYRQEPMPPHNLVLSLIGASLLWVGWFGFNAGSAVAANGNAGMAMAVTQIATAAAALTWMLIEWAKPRGKPSVLGIISGAVGGLVAITPASGFVDPRGALIIGIAAGAACYWGATWLKNTLGYDDSLDAFGVHGVGGMVGAMLTGVLAVSAVGGEGKSGLIDGNWYQVVIQGYGVVVVVLYCAIVSLILLKADRYRDRAARRCRHRARGARSRDPRRGCPVTGAAGPSRYLARPRLPRRYLPVFRPCCDSFDTDRSEFRDRREFVFFLNRCAHTELGVRRLRGGTDNRLRRRGDNMTQRSRTRLTVGAASLLAAAWQIGAAPIGLGAGADSRAEPRRAAAGDKRAQGRGGARCVADHSGADRTADREPEPDQLRYRLPAREVLFRRRAHRYGDVPEQSGVRQSRRDRRCAKRPGLAAEQRGAVPGLRDGGRLFVSDPRDPVLPYATRLPGTRSGRFRWPTARWS